MEKQIVILRDDLCTVSEFSIRYKITRAKVYELIREQMLAGVIISGTFYPDISDEAYLKSITRHEKQGCWSRSYRPGRLRDENDSDFEKAWRLSQGTV